MKHKKQFIQVAAGLLIAGALLWIAGRTMDWEQVRTSLASARIVWVLTSWFFVLVGTMLKGMRWKTLYTDHGPVTWQRLTGYLLVGQFMNALIPIRLGELAQAFLASKSSETPLGTNLALVLVLKFLDGIALLCSMVVLGLTLVLPEWFRTAAWGFAALFGVMSTIIGAVLWFRKPLQQLSNRLPGRLNRLVQTGTQGLTALIQSGQLLPALGLTVGIWLTSLLTEYTLFIGFDIPPTMAGALLLIVSHYISLLIPGVPAQVGVFHYVTVLCLGLFGISEESGMSYAIVLHGLIYSTVLLGGGAAVWLNSLNLGTLLRLKASAIEEEAG